jgi:hypothetical protein
MNPAPPVTRTLIIDFSVERPVEIDLVVFQQARPYRYVSGPMDAIISRIGLEIGPIAMR